MGAAVDSSQTFSGFEESMTKRPIYTDQHHSEFAFHRFSLLREKKILTAPRVSKKILAPLVRTEKRASQSMTPKI